MDRDVAEEFERVHAEFGRVHEEFGRVHEEFGLVHEEFGRVHEEFGRVHEQFGLVHSDIAGLRTEIGDVKRHATVLSESLRDEIRTLAEGYVATNERIDRVELTMQEGFTELRAMLRLSFGDLDRRLRTLDL